MSWDYYPCTSKLHALFPNARFVLGDINQTMGKEEDMTLYEQIRKILAKKTAALVTLDKSFRSTNEILKFSEQFLSPGCKHNSIGRTGEPPAVHSAGSQTALLDLIISEIRTCRESNINRSVCSVKMRRTPAICTVSQRICLPSIDY